MRPPAALSDGGGCGSCRLRWRRTKAATPPRTPPSFRGYFFLLAFWTRTVEVEQPTASAWSLRGSSCAKRRVSFFPRSNARDRSVPAQTPACPPSPLISIHVRVSLSCRHLRTDSGLSTANVGCIRAVWSLRSQESARCSGGSAGGGCRACIGACFGSRGWRLRLSRALGRSPCYRGGGRHGTTLSSRDQCMYLWIGI